jgi:hypothetical protein
VVRPGGPLAAAVLWAHDGHVRIESSVVSLSWIPSEAVAGGTRVAFDKGFTHYDRPPPEVIGDVEELAASDRFRFANLLQAWIEVDPSGRIVGHGYRGHGLMGSTTIRLGSLSHRFEAVALPDIQHDPVAASGSVRFVQTCGGRTGLPAPRRVRHRPFIQWQAPLVWTTLALTINADGTSTGELIGASPFPRHWVYDHSGALALRSGLTDFKDWYRKSFGKHSPWGDRDSEALVTAVGTALERAMSERLMGAQAKIGRFKGGEVVVREGDNGSDVFLVLDGVIKSEKHGKPLAEYGPGAILGERAALEGVRTSTLVAVTKVRLAWIPATLFELEELTELSQGRRREESEG